ncbi:uncharacterized protein LOC124152136 [Haliotis rufescens]|uniref:uncharacterized protein LOC124152136 n=1 Tax=Haliotis rufescens TaxID=6454 RepID=UPI00201F74E8|nr:uncharacterized protein LOC124152136 [Haliotis rufescens]
MGALQEFRIKRQMAYSVAMLIALSTCVRCRPLTSQPNGSLVNGTLAIVNGGNSNIGGGEKDAHGKWNVEGDNESMRSSKDKPYKVNGSLSNGSLPNGSVGNRGDSNGDDGENDTHGKTHVEGDNETFGSSKGKQDKGTSGTSALVFSSDILACLLATLLVPSCIT